LFLAAFVLLLFALALWLLGRRRYRASGLPAGRLIYVDTGAFGRLAEPLFSDAHRLTGKPDYLVQDGDDIVPVEVKTSRAPDAPFDSHVMQLAAYCLLVHETYGARPPYGIVKYPERAFAVDYTPELESALLETLAAMRAGRRARELSRSHNEPIRCQHCGVRNACEQDIG